MREKNMKSNSTIIMCTQNKNITGTKSPRIEKQNAPIKPMNGEILGTATANSTAAMTSTVL